MTAKRTRRLLLESNSSPLPPTRYTQCTHLDPQHPRSRRQKHKQELVALRGELKQLQAESKCGQKGKDLASKELEAAKKKLGDLKAKLDAMTTEKLALQQVRTPG